jgi:hypothetical protein
MTQTPNYTLGRGKVYFANYLAGTTSPDAFRYIGNTPEFSMTIESDKLDHTNSDEGINEVDDSVPLSVTRSSSLVCDDIQAENVAMFFYGSTSVLTTASLAGQSEAFASVVADMFYQIGLTSSNPVGIRGVNNVVVTSDPSGTTYVEGTDYRVDLDRGMVEIITGGTLAPGDDILVNYDILGTTQDLILSGSEPVAGALRFLENNPRGKNRDVFLPYVKVSPNGDMTMKGDEWRQLPFSLEILKPTGAEAIYINGKPFAV